MNGPVRDVRSCPDIENAHTHTQKKNARFPCFLVVHNKHSSVVLLSHYCPLYCQCSRLHYCNVFFLRIFIQYHHTFFSHLSCACVLSFARHGRTCSGCTQLTACEWCQTDFGDVSAGTCIPSMSVFGFDASSSCAAVYSNTTFPLAPSSFLTLSHYTLLSLSHTHTFMRKLNIHY